MAQTESKSCNKFNSFRIMNIETEFGKGRMKLSVFSLKPKILLEFLRLGSKLFHSIITNEKKEFLKKLCFVLMRGILLSVLVAFGVHITGIS